jgi:hypothetical protein
LQPLILPRSLFHDQQRFQPQAPSNVSVATQPAENEIRSDIEKKAMWKNTLKQKILMKRSMSTDKLWLNINLTARNWKWCFDCYHSTTHIIT